MEEHDNIEIIISKYLNGTITIEEHVELSAWLSQSKANQKEFDHLREIWLASLLSDGKLKFDYRDSFEEFKKKASQTETGSELQHKFPVKRFTITIPYHWAAAIVLVAIVCGALLNNLIPISSLGQSAILYQEITVPNGARSKILLPDGSQITLNAGTTMRYNNDFGKSSRDLWLDGEAYFVVNKSEMPFIVHSGTVKVKALGTQFNVRAYSTEKIIETTLVEGKVSVTNTNINSNDDNEVMLQPNQKLTVIKEEQPVKTPAVDKREKTTINNSKIEATPKLIPTKEIIKHVNIDPLPEISWKDDKWVIYREDLESLAVKLERKFDIKIAFKDKHLKSFRYNGTLPDESLEQVLNVMSLVSPIKYNIKGKTVVFSENK